MSPRCRSNVMYRYEQQLRNVAKQTANGTCYHLVGDEYKPVVVMIHGVGLNQNMWLPWKEVLLPSYRVLTFDFLGHGGSHNPPGERCVKNYVDQLTILLDHLNIDQVALVGFSMGALISQGMAALHPDRLTHLALLHSVYQRTDAQCAGVRKRYQITKKEGPMATVELAIERWFSKTYIEQAPDQMDEIRSIFAGHVDDGYLKAYGVFANAEPEMKRYLLDQFNQPALVVTGEQDVGSTPQMSEALARDLPNARLIINAGHRHGAPYEFAQMMAGQLLDFLNQYDNKLAE